MHLNHLEIEYPEPKCCELHKTIAESIKYTEDDYIIIKAKNGDSDITFKCKVELITYHGLNDDRNNN